MMLPETVRADLLRYLNQSTDHRAAGDSWKRRLSALLAPQMQSVLLYRLSRWLWERNWHRLAQSMSRTNALLFKVNIAPSAAIGPGLFLPHPPGISFCGHAGRGLTLYSLAVCCPAATAGWQADQGPQLGDEVSVGGHAVVQGPIRVGSRTKIGFSVVLQRDAPAGALVVSKAMRAAIKQRVV